MKTARVLAKSVVSNNLVKVALFGEDANWGRVLAAMGGSGADFDPERVDISFESGKNGVTLMQKGVPLSFDENTASKILGHDKVNINIDLNSGSQEASAYGCDLGYKYIKMNSEYRFRR